MKKEKKDNSKDSSMKYNNYKLCIEAIETMSNRVRETKNSNIKSKESLFLIISSAFAASPLLVVYQSNSIWSLILFIPSILFIMSILYLIRSYDESVSSLSAQDRILTDCKDKEMTNYKNGLNCGYYYSNLESDLDIISNLFDVKKYNSKAKHYFKMGIISFPIASMLYFILKF